MSIHVTEVIERLGGATKAAKRLGLKRTTVVMWKGRGVPLRHVPAVAAQLGVEQSEIWPAWAKPAAPEPLEAA